MVNAIYHVKNSIWGPVQGQVEDKTHAQLLISASVRTIATTAKKLSYLQ